MNKKFFPQKPDVNPTIYGYTELSSEYKGLIKVGYTERSVSERMKEHYPTKGPENVEKYEVLLEEPSMRNDGTHFKDYDVHKALIQRGFENVGGEWYKIGIDELKSVILSVREGTTFELTRNNDFKLRPEQKEAIRKTSAYFKNYRSQESKIPHFLWNCKMRFGKTFTTYKLAQEMSWRKILVLTFKPAVENSWKNDLCSHIDFKGWKFISRVGNTYEDIDKSKPFVCFASFQDFLGKNEMGGIKLKNEWAHLVNWDCIVLDEYHYGAWRETAKELFESEDLGDLKEDNLNEMKNWNENEVPLTTEGFLYLSGTPFRAIESGEFIEEQIFNWTYSDEQEAKENWKGDNNPYESLPRMVMMTYQLPESITHITDKGEFDEFDLNVFFSSTGEYENSRFKYENEVQKWLNLLRGTEFETIYDNLKLGRSKPVLPFSDTRLLKVLNHTFWFLPSVSSCYAMKNLLEQPQNVFFQDYKIMVVAGKKVGVGVKALELARKGMGYNPLNSKSITLSCGKLTTGVTVKPWNGLFMLRNTKSPETYFQTAFRVQSPWTVSSSNNDSPNQEEILKKECYVFDFSPNRALKLITDYSCRLNFNESNPESKVNEFIKFLPILCFDGSSMRKINSQEVLDFAALGTSGSQLAKKFESARLVHVDDETLKKLMANQQAMNALMKIEGFRNLNTDIEKIINKSQKIKKAKRESPDDPKNKKKEISQEQKEQRSLRKKIQEKLQKFATRIPVFMYLTDYRERTLKDVITQLEPDLFKRVTGLYVDDFELLISIGLFKSSLMNSAVFSFKRYEDASLSYSGFTKHEASEVGLYDTVISSEEFKGKEIK
ncbi:MAG: DEAD/DEAH box helicase family protein [Flavobacteriaceae bacterium]|nr:DEAD/DEAH box helicase family protein [Flavobacteriaceae bacterium]